MKMQDGELVSKKKIRDANIELLRIAAMFMIVIYHIVCHCVNVQLTNPESVGQGAAGVFNHPVFLGRLLILNTVMTFGIIGNAVFILISGYFMANRDASDIKLGKISWVLVTEQLFAAMLLTIVPTIYHLYNPDLHIKLQTIMGFNGMSWFVGYYFVVVLCGALFLNKFLAGLDCKKYAAFLLTLFAFISFSWSGGLAEGLAGGLRTLLTGIFLYALGGFIRQFNPFRSIKVYTILLIIFFVYLLVWISGYNVTENNIQSYIQSASQNPFMQSVPGFDNFSIVTLVLAVCMFEIFRRINIPANRVIAFLGKSTFMVYLIHDSEFFYSLWNLRDWITTLSESMPMFIIQLLKWGAYTFFAGVLAYTAYMFVCRVIDRRLNPDIRRQMPVQ